MKDTSLCMKSACRPKRVRGGRCRALSMMQRKILTAAAAAITGSPTRKGDMLVYPKSSQVTKSERLKDGRSPRTIWIHAL
jgi:hypothetical protein